MQMHVTTYNAFKGFYVATKSDKTFDGLELHYWAETVEECKQWIKENETNRKRKAGSKQLDLISFGAEP